MVVAGGRLSWGKRLNLGVAAQRAVIYSKALHLWKFSLMASLARYLLLHGGKDVVDLDGRGREVAAAPLGHLVGRGPEVVIA